MSGTIHCADPQELAIALEYLPEHVALSRAEPGCLYFAIDQTDDPMTWRVEELFADARAFEAHKARVADAVWSRVSATLRRDIRRIDG